MSGAQAWAADLLERLTQRQARAKRDFGQRQAIAFMSGLSFMEIDQRMKAGEHSANMAPLADDAAGMEAQLISHDRRLCAYLDWRMRHNSQTGLAYIAIDKAVNSGALIPVNFNIHKGGAA